MAAVLPNGPAGHDEDLARASAAKECRPVLALTMGDPAGIGPELCLRALNAPAGCDRCVPVIFGDRAVLERVAEEAALPPLNCRIISSSIWEKAKEVREPLLVDCGSIAASSIQPGVVAAECGRAAFAYIELAIQAAIRGKVAGVVTAPLNKEALRLAGVPFPGHTEIFTALTGAKRSCMMLHSDALTVSMVTTHIGYQDVPSQLTVERVVDVIQLTADAMGQILSRPLRLGVCGLNPHAGEHGLFGNREEERLLIPAIEEARHAALNVSGPIPPDVAFVPAQRQRLDAVITLYHDQGHIPFKMLAFDTGVNITLGLPIIRTSVDHGTAFDIAWRGVASPQSFFAAIHAAAVMATRQL